MGDTESTWPAASCTEVMSSPRMSTLPSPPSRPREPSSSSTGAQLASSAVSTTSHPLSCQVVNSPRSCAPSAWSPTPLPLLRSSPELITSSILCTPREPSSIGTSERVWKKVSSQRPERILPPSRRITRRSELRPPRVRVKKRVWSDHSVLNYFTFIPNNIQGEGGVVGLHDSVGHLGGGHHGEGEHHAVGVLLADLGDEESSHTGTGTATEGVAELEALEAVAGLGLLADNIEHGVDQLGTLGVVALGPVVTGAGLAEHEVVGAEELTEGASADRVQGTGLEVHEDGAGHVAAASGLVVVHVDALQLEVGVTVVGTGGVNAVLVGDDLPELGTNLVTALASLDVNELAHFLLSLSPH